MKLTTLAVPLTLALAVAGCSTENSVRVLTSDGKSVVVSSASDEGKEICAGDSSRTLSLTPLVRMGDVWSGSASLTLEGKAAMAVVIVQEFDGGAPSEQSLRIEHLGYQADGQQLMELSAGRVWSDCRTDRAYCLQTPVPPLDGTVQVRIDARLQQVGPRVPSRVLVGLVQVMQRQPSLVRSEPPGIQKISQIDVNVGELTEYQDFF